MATLDDPIILENIQELRDVMKHCNGKLVRSRVSTDDCFANLSYGPPTLKHPSDGISKLVVNLFEMISNLLLEDTEENKSIGRVIVMIFEYYFLTAPVIFKGQGSQLVNDMIFMTHLIRYIQSLKSIKAQTKRDLRNIIMSMEIYDPLKELN